MCWRCTIGLPLEWCTCTAAGALSKIARSASTSNWCCACATGALNRIAHATSTRNWWVCRSATTLLSGNARRARYGLPSPCRYIGALHRRLCRITARRWARHIRRGAIYRTLVYRSRRLSHTRRVFLLLLIRRCCCFLRRSTAALGSWCTCSSGCARFLSHAHRLFLLLLLFNTRCSDTPCGCQGRGGWCPWRSLPWCDLTRSSLR